MQKMKGTYRMNRTEISQFGQWLADNPKGFMKSSAIVQAFFISNKRTKTALNQPTLMEVH